MTDRELLERAAKAAGIVSLRWGVDKPERQISGEGQYIGATWNPLTNDSDAFRLMVKLGLFGSREVEHYRTLAHICENCPDDAAVYRRAITRAAAALQEAKEGV